MNIFDTSRLVTISRLVTHFFCGHDVRRFTRGDCTEKNLKNPLLKIYLSLKLQYKCKLTQKID